MKQARLKIASIGLNNISFECVDAAELHDFKAMEYNVIFSRFGVMFFDDLVAAFNNIQSALKAGGRLTFICWQSIEDNQWVNLPKEIDPEAPGGFDLGTRIGYYKFLKMQDLLT